MLAKHLDLLSITLMYAVLLHGTYDPIVKSTLDRICNILKLLFFLSNIISVLSNHTLFMSRKPS